MHACLATHTWYPWQHSIHSNTCITTTTHQSAQPTARVLALRENVKRMPHSLRQRERQGLCQGEAGWDGGEGKGIYHVYRRVRHRTTGSSLSWWSGLRMSHIPSTSHLDAAPPPDNRQTQRQQMTKDSVHFSTGRWDWGETHNLLDPKLPLGSVCVSVVYYRWDCCSQLLHVNVVMTNQPLCNALGMLGLTQSALNAHIVNSCYKVFMLRIILNSNYGLLQTLWVSLAVSRCLSATVVSFQDRLL